MFVDASAMVAILCAEPGYVDLADRLRSSGEPITSAFAIFETVMALSRKDGLSIENAETEVHRFLESAGIAVVPVAADESREALAAHSRFGKGRRHPAQLNMGDCFAYACAKTHDKSLLFVGDDFSQTDIESAMD